VVPHLGIELAGAIGERELNVELAALTRAHLLGSNDEGGRDGLVLVLRRVGNIEIFHQESVPGPATPGFRRGRKTAAAELSYNRVAGNRHNFRALPGAVLRVLWAAQ